MSKNKDTSKIVDTIIKIGSSTAFIATVMIAPNLVVALDKPLTKLHKTLDKRARDREAMRIIRNMKANGYLAGDYEHGLHLTDKAKKRLQRILLDELSIKPTKTWDKKWRIVIYDVPEKYKPARNLLSSSLRAIGCFQLQKSTWITPFPCLDVIETIATHYDLDDYVTYFEALNLSNEKVFIGRFKKKYPSTIF